MSSNTSAETPEEGKHTPSAVDVEGMQAYHAAKHLLSDGDEEYKILIISQLIARAPSLERENAELKKRVAELEAEVTRLGVIIQQIDSENHNLRQKIKLLQELKNEIGLYLRRMAEQEATIRELCDTKSGQAETIKRYKEALEAAQDKIFHYPLEAASIIRSALSGTNE